MENNQLITLSMFQVEYCRLWRIHVYELESDECSIYFCWLLKNKNNVSTGIYGYTGCIIEYLERNYHYGVHCDRMIFMPENAHELSLVGVWIYNSTESIRIARCADQRSYLKPIYYLKQSGHGRTSRTGDIRNGWYTTIPTIMAVNSLVPGIYGKHLGN